MARKKQDEASGAIFNNDFPFGGGGGSDWGSRQATTEKKPAGKSKSFLPILIGGVVLVVVLGLVGYKVWSSKKSGSASDTTAKQVQGESERLSDELKTAQRIRDAVSLLTAVPTGTDPQVAVISDITKLPSQPFFQEAQNGDYLVIYTEKGIIYRESENKIVAVTTLQDEAKASTGANNTPVASSSTPAATASALTVEIRNGSGKAGFGAIIKSKIEGSSVVVQKVGNAANSNYPDTVIYAAPGVDVSALETTFGVKAVSTLPAGEGATASKVLVILGKATKS